MTQSPSIIPAMRYSDPAAAIAFLMEAFGFEERMVVAAEDGSIMHAELTHGNGMIMLGGARDDHLAEVMQPSRPESPCTSSVYVIVSDVDAHYRRALDKGATIVVELTQEPYGKMYACRDLQGQLWSFGDYDPWKAPDPS